METICLECGSPVEQTAGGRYAPNDPGFRSSDSKKPSIDPSLPTTIAGSTAGYAGYRTMTTKSNSPIRRFPALASLWPVLLVAGLMVVALLAVSGAYGFHRDELYFIVAGRHPAFGYPDQPPLTPLLSAASVALLGLSPTAVRVLPALAMGLVVVLTALMARDLADPAGRSCWPPSRSPSPAISPPVISTPRPPTTFSSRRSSCGSSSGSSPAPTRASGWP